MAAHHHIGEGQVVEDQAEEVGRHLAEEAGAGAEVEMEAEAEAEGEEEVEAEEEAAGDHLISHRVPPRPSPTSSWPTSRQTSSSTPTE